MHALSVVRLLVEMHFSVKCLILVFICVHGYKITSDTSVANDDQYSLLVSNQSFDVPLNDFEGDEMKYQQKSATSADDDIRSEALIKKIHPFVFPKQFNTVDKHPAKKTNTTHENLVEIRNMELNQLNNDRLDDSYGQADQKHHSADLIPFVSHLYGGSKHAPFQFGYYDRPYHHNYYPAHSNHCLLGLLNSVDPLVLLGVLGFLAFIINSVLTLVDRVNLPAALLAPAMAAVMPAAVINSAATTKLATGQRQGVDDRNTEGNQKLLKDFERILQMAIDMHEQKMSSVQ